MAQISPRRLSSADKSHSAKPRSGCGSFLAAQRMNDRQSRAVLCGRLLFIACLCGAAAALGVISHHFLTESETDLAETLFESIADRGLTEAYGITRRKRLATLTMASMVSEMHPNASDWPFVFVQGFERIVNNLLNSTSGDNMGFIPFVNPVDMPAWEEFAYDYYYNGRSPPFPNTTAVNSFGRGAWAVDPALNTTDRRFHDAGGETRWASPNQLVTPLLHVDEGANRVLLFNMRSEPFRGTQIDGIIECSNKLAASGELEDHKCGAVTEMVRLVKFPESRGPGAVMFQPIYPANDRSTLVGLIPAAVIWEDILDNVFPADVSGIDCVLSTGTRVYTYTVTDGVARLSGEGDLHSPQYDKFRRSRLVTGDELYTDISPVYELCLYPTDVFFEFYSTTNPRAATIGSVLIIVATSMMFLLYDFFVRREFSAKTDLLEAKRRFMRFVSHEVRTPLNSVCMGLTVIQAEIASSLGYKSAEDLELRADEAAKLVSTPGHEEDAKYLEWFSLAHEVRANAQSAVDVLNDLLNYDKIENGELNLELTPIRTWRLIERAANEFKLPASEKKLHFDINFEDLQQGDVEKAAVRDLSSALPDEVLHQKLIGDEVRLTQVFRNLLSNALKFTPEEGTVSISASWIRSSKDDKKDFVLKNGDKVSFQSSGRLRIRVRDTGAGMSDKQLEQLFRQGVQFNVNELQAGQGSGLGLYITKGIVEQHEGTLVATSEGLGTGTTFTMTLPLYHVPDVTETSDCSDDQLEKGDGVSGMPDAEDIATLRILIVDDVSSNRKLLGRLLKKNGHDIYDAENGQIAVDMVAESLRADNPYDTVLMDYEMPVMNGPTAAKELRSMGSDVFIVGVTGNLLPEDVAHFQACGANAILPKPFRMPSLEELWVEFGVTK